ncbi:MAG: MJ0042-type zinc finger domain-containing protein, partial [Nitrosopumilaceae archaeon]
MYVNCPSCKGSYYLVALDFLNNPDSKSRCPFCGHVFPYKEGNPTIGG